MPPSRTLVVWLGLALGVAGCEPILGADFDDKTVRADEPSSGSTGLPSTTGPGTSSSSGGGGGAGGQPTSSSSTGGAACDELEPELFFSVADATVDCSQPTANEGDFMAVIVDGTFPLQQNALIRFEDFGLVGTVGTLLSAEMCVVQVGDVGNDGQPVTFEVFELAKPWVELEVTWDEAAAGMPWMNDTGGDQSEIVATDTLTVTDSQRPVTACYDVTSFVERVLAGTTENNGFVFAAKAGAPDTTVQLGAREHLNPEHRPKLEIRLCDPRM